MRGIEFRADIGYGNIINDLLSGIDISMYEFNIINEDILFDENDKNDNPVKIKIDPFNEHNKYDSYLVFFLNLQAYLLKKQKSTIKTFEDFKKSNCEFLILISDGWCVEIYVKNENLLLQFIKNAISIKAKDITIKTDYNDGRIDMLV